MIEDKLSFMCLHMCLLSPLLLVNFLLHALHSSAGFTSGCIFLVYIDICISLHINIVCVIHNPVRGGGPSRVPRLQVCSTDRIIVVHAARDTRKQILKKLGFQQTTTKK